MCSANSNRYFVPICSALLTLLLALNYMRDQGFTSLPERKGDWYIGFGYSLAMGNGYHDCLPPANDPSGYRCVAPFKWITAYRLPGYPFYLAANILAFGKESPLVSIRLLQAVLASLTVFIMSTFAGRFGGVWAAVLTGLLLATDPAMQMYSHLLYTEMLYTFLLVIAIFILSFSRRWWKLAVAGLILGAATLTRGNLAALLPLLPVVYRPFRALIPIAIGLIIAFTPWAIRNAIILHEFVPFSTGSGSALWGANNPQTFGIDPPSAPTGDWIAPPSLPSYLNQPDLTEVQFDRAEQRAAIDFMRSVPLDRLISAAIAKLSLQRGLDSPWLIGDPSTWLFYLWLILAILAIFSAHLRQAFLHLVRQRGILLLFAVCAAAVFNAVYFYGSSRFRMPIDPFLAVLCSLSFLLLVHELIFQYARLKSHRAE